MMRDDTTKSRLEILKRRSEFLGIRMEDMDEYKSLQAGELGTFILWEFGYNDNRVYLLTADAFVPATEQEARLTEEAEWQRVETSETHPVDQIHPAQVPQGRGREATTALPALGNPRLPFPVHFGTARESHH